MLAGRADRAGAITSVAAGEQRRPQLQSGWRQRRRRQLQEHVVGAHGQKWPAHQPNTARCGNATPFGTPVEPEV